MILIKFMDITYPTPFDIINAPTKSDIYNINTPYEGVFSHTFRHIQQKLNFCLPVLRTPASKRNVPEWSAKPNCFVTLLK